MLSKNLRLNKKEILLVKQKALPYFSKTLTLLVLKSDSHKFGIIVSNKFSKKAVVRNKIKRQIFRYIKNNINLFSNNYYVFIPKPKILEDSINIDNELNYLVNKATSITKN